MGDIDVDGDRNRVAGRDFIEIHMASGTELLSPEQRKRLNLLVTNISNEYKVDAWTLWKEVVHTRTGVSKVGEIPKDKFEVAEKALLDHAEHLHSLAHAKRLVAELLQVANERGVYADLTRFCSREFGVTVLTKLNPEQLKQALRFLESSTASAPQANAQPSPDVHAPLSTKAVRAKPSFVPGALEFVRLYPVHCGVVGVVLMFLGRIIL